MPMELKDYNTFRKGIISKPLRAIFVSCWRDSKLAALSMNFWNNCYAWLTILIPYCTIGECPVKDCQYD